MWTTRREEKKKIIVLGENLEPKRHTSKVVPAAAARDFFHAFIWPPCFTVTILQGQIKAGSSQKLPPETSLAIIVYT